MARLPLGIHAWRWLGILVTPLTPLLLRERAARGKEDSARMGERLGVASAARPDGRLVWIHGASVGESLAALPLIEKLLAEDIRVLVTSGTVTSANMMQARLPAGAIHQYVPLDTPRAIARFLDHWRPAAGLFVESDLWPNLLLEAQRRGVKLALINARISERSAAGWRRAPHTARTLLGVFNKILAQDEDFAARFRALGAHEVTVAGSLKADAPPLSCDENALAATRAMMRGLFGTRNYAEMDEPRARAVYDRYFRRVRELVPDETGRRLEYKLGSGWEPLCAFLGRPVPDVPFPRVNENEEFTRGNEREYRVTVRKAWAAIKPWALTAVSVGVVVVAVKYYRP